MMATLQLKQKRRRWTEGEDKKLVDFMSECPHHPWEDTAMRAGLGNRTNKSCWERWNNQLKPDVRKENFTPEEDALIIFSHRIYGNKWASIRDRIQRVTANETKNRGHLQWRTANDIKNRYNNHLKKKLATSNQLNTPDKHLIHPNQNIPNAGSSSIPTSISALQEITNLQSTSEACLPKFPIGCPSNDAKWNLGLVSTSPRTGIEELAGPERSTDKNCWERSNYYLKPGINQENFSQEEDDNIIRLNWDYANRWATIAANPLLRGRSPNAIENRWNNHLKKRLEIMSELERVLPYVKLHLLTDDDASDHSVQGDDLKRLMIELDSMIRNVDQNIPHPPHQTLPVPHKKWPTLCPQKSFPRQMRFR